MTTPHRATPEQWKYLQEEAIDQELEASCILELRARIEALEAALHALTTAHNVQPCQDCIEVHGDTRQEWLLDCPEGAEYRSDYHAYLCDGCYDARREHDQLP